MFDKRSDGNFCGQILPEDADYARIKKFAIKTYVAFSNRSRAQGYTEYVILLALIAILAYSAVQFLGAQIASDLFDKVSPSV